MPSMGPLGWQSRSRGGAQGVLNQRCAADETSPRFVLYVEGARDRGILQAWARRLLPALGRALAPRIVILGGRRPARAHDHFRTLGGAAAGIRALVLLDRDDGQHAGHAGRQEPGLDLYVWGRRHIESYLLVPAALRRCLMRRVDPALLERTIRDCLPEVFDEEAYRTLNAKHLLGSRGALGRLVGGVLPPVAIARSMHADELHPDVLALFDRIRRGLARREDRQRGARGGNAK